MTENSIKPLLLARQFSNGFGSLNPLQCSEQPYEHNPTLTLILQLRKSRHREGTFPEDTQIERYKAEIQVSYSNPMCLWDLH